MVDNFNNKSSDRIPDGVFNHDNAGGGGGGAGQPTF
jgi:hypothetical protein